jgi:hypothetical protein
MPPILDMPVCKADAEGVRLIALSEITESVWGSACFFILIAGAVSGISAASSSSSEDSSEYEYSSSDSDVENELSDDTSEG